MRLSNYQAGQSSLHSYSASRPNLPHLLQPHKMGNFLIYSNNNNNNNYPYNEAKKPITRSLLNSSLSKTFPGFLLSRAAPQKPDAPATSSSCLGASGFHLLLSAAVYILHHRWWFLSRTTGSSLPLFTPCGDCTIVSSLLNYWAG